MTEAKGNIQISAKEFQDACVRADARLKSNEGHNYVTILKTRCSHCRRSPNQKGRCKYWFRTFLSNLSYEITGTYNSNL